MIDRVCPTSFTGKGGKWQQGVRRMRSTAEARIPIGSNEAG